MTPHLKKLFEQAEPGPLHVEYNEEEEGAQYALCQHGRDGAVLGDIYQPATAKKFALLYTHGPALVEALEESANIFAKASARYDDAELYHIGLEITKLLLTLEKEAGA